MRVKNIQLHVGDVKEGLTMFAETLAKARRGLPIATREVVAFSTLNAFKKALTQRRLELLHIIKEKMPGSIYELARLAQRDLKSVNGDINILKELGLVSLESIEEERKKMKPHLVYEKLSVDISI